MHPLLRHPVVAAVERAVSAHLDRAWSIGGFTDLDDRASHPAGIYHSAPSVFAKPDPAGSEQFTAELRGLELLRGLGPVATPHPVAGGVVPVGSGAA